MIVDLHDRKAEGREIFGRKVRQFCEVLLIGRLAIGFGIPGAVADGLRMQLDVTLGGDRVGPCLQAQPCIVEITDGEGFQFFRLAGGQRQAAVVDPGGQPHVVVFNGGKHDAAAPRISEPAGDDAMPALRVGEGEPDVTAGIFAGRQQAAGAERRQLAGRPAEPGHGLPRLEAAYDPGFRSAVVQRGAKKSKRQIGKKLDRVASAVRAGDDNRLARTEDRMLDAHDRGGASLGAELSVGQKRLRRRLRGDGKAAGGRIILHLQHGIFDRHGLILSKGGQTCEYEHQAKRGEQRGFHGRSASGRSAEDVGVI